MGKLTCNSRKHADGSGYMCFTNDTRRPRFLTSLPVFESFFETYWPALSFKLSYQMLIKSRNFIRCLKLNNTFPLHGWLYYGEIFQFTFFHAKFRLMLRIVSLFCVFFFLNLKCHTVLTMYLLNFWDNIGYLPFRMHTYINSSFFNEDVF